MRCPAISELPTSANHDWPWTEESPRVPATMADGNPWPRVSVVTPSFNHGAFVEETIRSVLLQGYPDLDYVVVDGGSTDGSVDVIRRYEPWLTWWVSEPDRGQSHAVNKGIRRTTGDILAWVNTSDILAPGAVARVAALMAGHSLDWVVGASYLGAGWTDPGRTYLLKNPTGQRVREGGTFLQPSSFFRRSLFERAGGLDERLHYVLDYDLWIRFLRTGGHPYVIADVLSLAREHGGMKTRDGDQSRIRLEKQMIMRRNFSTGQWYARSVRNFARRGLAAARRRLTGSR